MEPDQKIIGVEECILKLPPTMQVRRLNELFDQKIIDFFIADYEKVHAKTPQLIQSTEGFKEKYSSMKATMKKIEQNLEISKSPYEGWGISQVDQNIQIGIRTNGTQLQLRGSGKIKSGVKELLILVYLVKLYHTWAPFCKQSRDIKELSPLEKAAFVLFKIPFIKERYAVIRGIGIDRIDHNNSVCVFAEGRSDKTWLAQQSIQVQKYVDSCELLDVKHFTVELRYVSATETDFTCYALVDHHVRFLPEWMVKFVIKQMARLLLTGLIKKICNFQGTEWAKELRENYQENQYFYSWIDQKISRWAGKLKMQP